VNHWQRDDDWEDYYEILQVSPDASPEVIKAAYRALAKKYHPDQNSSPEAVEKMKKINEAYQTLIDPQKRKKYDEEWRERKGKSQTSTFSSQAQSVPPPKPVVTPDHVFFREVDPGEVKRASFTLRNAGGPYQKIWIENPDSWVRIVRCVSLADTDELPLRVELEAEGEEWGKRYEKRIEVKLDNESTYFKVILKTKEKPEPKVSSQKVASASSSFFTSTSSYSTPRVWPYPLDHGPREESRRNEEESEDGLSILFFILGIPFFIIQILIGGILFAGCMATVFAGIWEIIKRIF